MTNLSDAHLDALANLQRKARGRQVYWINIADARALVDFGLALKTRQGWALTPAGEAQLAQGSQRPLNGATSVTQLRGLRLVVDPTPSHRRDE